VLSADGELAISGGAPVRTDAYPAWPQVDQRDAAAVADAVLHGQIGGLLALENTPGVDTGLTVHVGNAASITQQPAGGGELPPLIDRGQRVADGQCGKLLDPVELIDWRCKFCGNPPVLRQSRHMFLKLSAFAEPLKRLLEPMVDLYVTVIDGCLQVYARQQRHSEWRGHLSLAEIAIWRDFETSLTQMLAGYESKPFYLIARQEPAEALLRLCRTPHEKTIYLSYPITAILEENPGLIESALGVGEQLRQATLDRLESSKATKISRPEVFRILNEVNEAVAKGEPPLKHRRESPTALGRMQSMISLLSGMR